MPRYKLWQVRVLVDGNLRLCGVFEDSDAAQQNDMRSRFAASGGRDRCRLTTPRPRVEVRRRFATFVGEQTDSMCAIRWTECELRRTCLGST